MKRVGKTGKISWLANPIYRGERLGAKSFPTKRQAERYDRQMVEAAEKGGGVENRTLGEAMERYRKEITPGKRGERWEDIRLQKLGRDKIASKRLAKLEDADLEDWITRERRVVVKYDEFGKPQYKKDASIRREFTILVQVLKYCRKWKWMRHNPAELVYDRPANSPDRERRIEPWEFEGIVEVLKGRRVQTDRKAWQVAVAWEFAIETGMRCGEILSLAPEQVSLEDGYPIAHLLKTKNGDQRKVPLSERAEELWSWVPDGFTVRAQSCDPIFRKAVKEACVIDLTFHDSRHEAASRFVEAGYYPDLLDLCKVMGWRDPKMAMKYYNPKVSDYARRLRER
jgi:integrase